MKLIRVYKKGWFQLLVGGAFLFFLAEQTLKYTGNINFVPAVMLFGSMAVPVAFVAYFFQQERLLDAPTHRESPIMMVALCFIVGGMIGIIVAGFLEYQTITHMGFAGLLGVAVIEEVAKLILPVILFIRGKCRSEIDGLLIGTASGMGFAALETMGYGLVALLESQGSVGALQEVLLIRGLLSPVGHAAWTGLVCAALWHYRDKTGKPFHPAVIWFFIVAVVLHFLWNLGGTFNIVINYVGYIVVGAVSLILLVRRLRESKKTSKVLRANVESEISDGTA